MAFGFVIAAGVFLGAALSTYSIGVYSDDIPRARALKGVGWACSGLSLISLLALLAVMLSGGSAP